METQNRPFRRRGEGRLSACADPAIVGILMTRFLFDTHVHTAEVSPCGVLTARQMVRAYRDAGYSGLVVTDHCTPGTPVFSGRLPWTAMIDRYLHGYRLAREEGERLGLTVLWGLELTLGGRHPGDFLVFGVDEAFLKANPRLFDLELGEVRRRIVELGARADGSTLGDAADVLICQAHPFRPGQRPADPQLLDGVEVHNANPRHHSRNELAEAFARRHRLLRTAGSDAHQVEDVGRAGIWLPRLPRSAADLATLLRDPACGPLHLPDAEAAGGAASA